MLEISVDHESHRDIEIYVGCARHAEPLLSPLGRMVTLLRKLIKERRRLPSCKFIGAMNDYIDIMDVSQSGEFDNELTANFPFVDVNRRAKSPS